MLITNVLLLLASAVYTVTGECASGCKEPTLFYESLKCKPIFTSPKDCCPVQYDCSHIQATSLTDTKCYFHGKSYNVGKSINDAEVYGSCRVGCTCQKRRSGRTGFECAYLDCPRSGPFSKPDCHIKYELDKCCSTGEVCPPFSAVCEVNGKTYNEGERFDAPIDKCKSCVCQEGFKGEFVEPFCKKQECMDEINYQSRIRNFCAPSYRSLDDCCPFNWVCSDFEDVFQVKNATEENQHLLCRFETTLLKIGDKLERTDQTTGGKLSCECRIPPFLTCIQDYKYSTYSGEF